MGEKDVLSGVFLESEIRDLIDDAENFEQINFDIDDFIDEIYVQVNLIYDSLKTPEIEKKLEVYESTARKMSTIDPQYSNKLFEYIKTKRKEYLLD